MSGFLGSGLAFPLGVDRRGRIALAHGEDDIEQALQIILGTAPGERPMRPEFGCGIHRYVFDVVDAETLGRMELEISRAIERWEPRVDLTGVRFDTSTALDGRLEITIDYRVRATNHVRNLVYPFYIIPAEERA
jgi:phage baseplate assembly protein W